MNVCKVAAYRPSRLRLQKELTAFLKAYASGLITLPDGMMEAEAAADPDDDMEDSDHEE